MRYHPDDIIEKHKKRLTTQSFSQIYQIDYIKIFAQIII